VLVYVAHDSFLKVGAEIESYVSFYIVVKRCSLVVFVFVSVVLWLDIIIIVVSLLPAARPEKNQFSHS